MSTPKIRTRRSATHSSHKSYIKAARRMRERKQRALESRPLAMPVGKRRRLELVRRQGPRPDINVRFATENRYATVKAAAKELNESMSYFMEQAALERAASRCQLVPKPEPESEKQPA